MRKKIFLITLSALLLILSSCSSFNTRYLDVCSLDYVGLKKLESSAVDEALIKSWHLSWENPYNEYVCCVSEKDGKLMISKSFENDTSFTMRADNGYFVGVDMGEYDGWVKYYPYPAVGDSDASQTVVSENCKGIIKIDNKNGYVLTGLRHILSDCGAIYKLSLPSIHEKWEWSKVADLSSVPMAYAYDDESNSIYIATALELLKYSISTNTVTTLADVSLWEFSGATSMVILGGKIYLGMGMGIYEYDIATATTAWFPVDFEKYAS